MFPYSWSGMRHPAALAPEEEAGLHRASHAAAPGNYSY